MLVNNADVIVSPIVATIVGSSAQTTTELECKLAGLATNTTAGKAIAREEVLVTDTTLVTICSSNAGAAMGRAGLGASCHQKPGLSLQNPEHFQKSPRKAPGKPCIAVALTSSPLCVCVSPLGVNWVIEIGAGGVGTAERTRELPAGGAVGGLLLLGAGSSGQCR